MEDALVDEALIAGAVAVACSGGRDSTALLHATWRAARPLGLTVYALHVNHGLSASADAWEAQVRAQCARWSRPGGRILCQVRRLRLWVPPGESIEAVAREARYAALAEMALAAHCRVVLLAHHANDQAETFLLQALRGAGAAGLAAMPPDVLRQGICWVRPWLDQPRRAVEAYLRRHRLSYVDDDSNAQLQFARNRLRRQVWPALEEAFPDALKVLGAAARHAQDASACLDALADLDLARLAADREGEGEGRLSLDLNGLLSLEGPRRRNLLRRWLRDRLGRPAPASLIDRLADELRGQGAAEWPLDEASSLRCRAGRLMVCEGSDPLAQKWAAPRPIWVATAGRRVLPVPDWRGTLRLTPVLAGGVALSRVGTLCLVARGGGEAFQRAPMTPARALKKQFQAAGVPAWLRAGPLVHDAEGRLLFVPGLGLDARALAAAGEPQVMIDWCPDRAALADGPRVSPRIG